MTDPSPEGLRTDGAAAQVVDAQWRAVVAGLRRADDAAWRRPTRLPGWAVEDLARHVHWGVSLELDGLALVGTDGSRRAAGREAPADRTALVEGLDAARAELVRHLERLGPHGGRVVPMPYGDLPLDVATQVVFVMEAVVHRSDLADALAGTAAGDAMGPPALDPAGTGAVAAFVEGFWPALAAGASATPPPGTTVELRGATVRLAATYDGAAWGRATGAPVTTVSGPDDALLLWALGRRDLGAPLVVSGGQEHAERFKDYVPGP